MGFTSIRPGIFRKVGLLAHFKESDADGSKWRLEYQFDKQIEFGGGEMREVALPVRESTNTVFLQIYC